MKFDNRITRMLGVETPIVQAPMGFIARAQLASAVSRAGALGIIETSSGQLDAIRDEITKMRELTDRPFGVNVAQAFIRDPSIIDFVIEQGVHFVTTSAGSPTKYTKALKEAGLTVYHVVPTLRAAQKAVKTSRTLRCCCRHVATTLSIRSTKRLPASLSVPPLLLRHRTA